MFDNAPISTEVRQFDANGRAAAIAANLEHAALVIDTAFHGARAFSALDGATYSQPITDASASLQVRALNGVIPQPPTIGDSPEQHIFIMAAIVGARHLANFWSHPNRQDYSDRSGSVVADLVRWMASACDMGCCFLDIRSKASFPAAELPDHNARAEPIRGQHK